MIQEIIIQKVSVHIAEVKSPHLLETVRIYIENNKQHFLDRSWTCNVKTSLGITKNILYDVEEFKYLREEIEKIVRLHLYEHFKKSKPFAIFDSWINILQENGYQEPHIHGDCVSGVLYLSEENSDIEFLVFTNYNVNDIRQSLKPKKGQILLFDGKTYHRVTESKKERISLAFNIKVF